MTWFTLQSLFVIVLAFLLGLFVGWLLWQRAWKPVALAAAPAGVIGAPVAAAQGVDDLTTEHDDLDDDLARGVDAGLEDEYDEVEVEPAAGPHLVAVPPPVEDEPFDQEAFEEAERVAAAARAAEASGDGSDDGAGGAEVIDLRAAAGGPEDTLEVIDEAADDSPDETGGTDATDEPVEVLDVAAAEDVVDVTGDDVSTTADEDGTRALADAPAITDATDAPAEQAEILPVAAAAGPVKGTGTAGGDRLERIEGIGPKIAGALRTAGLTTFEAVAAADVDTLKAALSAAGLRFAPSLPTWARQAGLLAAGDEDGFQALIHHLVGGRDVSGTTR